jgi:signal-transduction protein with cAMP-binding, CBS, and nucleotidyltransferase domain
MTQEDYLISLLRKDDCKRLIKKDINKISYTATIREAITKLRSNWNGYVCILDKEEKLQGIITERDILSFIGSENFNENNLATTIMTKDFKTIECKESITEIALTLYRNTFRHIAILEEGKLLGIVSARDFIHYLVEYFAETVHTILPGQPTQDRREGA